MRQDGGLTWTTRLQWGLAVVVLCAVGVLAWYGYGAATEWQSSSAVLVERRSRELATLLTTALNRDMRGAQVSVLGGPEWNAQFFAAPYEIDDVVATAFARYPYPDSFFGWRVPDNTVRFFTRADRPPGWAPESIRGAHYPVRMSLNAPVAARLQARIARDVAAGHEYSAFNTRINERTYQVIARLVYREPTRQTLDCAFGFMVDLDWTWHHYFAGIAQQASSIGSASEGFEYAITDERAVPVASSSAPRRGQPTTRTFTALFIDPSVVALDPPSDLPRPVWTVSVWPGHDSALELAAQGSQRTLLVVSAAALLAALGLLVTVRAAHANARIAAMRSDFVSAVTHELKTPLATIRTIADTLVRGGVTTGDQVRTYAELLVQEERRLVRLVDNLLAYARVTDVAEVYSFEPVPPRDLAAEVLARFGRQLADGGFELQVDVEDRLPCVKVDRTSVVLALDNIIDNAIRYSGTSKEASLTIRRNGHGVVFRVQDHGVGIPVEDLERVQRRFVRGRTPTSHGSGLGLAIVRRIADDHGGELHIESTPGIGTVVTLSVPTASESDAGGETHSDR